MKNIIFFLLLTFIGTNSSQAHSIDPAGTQYMFLDSVKYKIEFDTRMIPLGKIKKGEKASGEYLLTNTGTEDITIEFASSCDCTTVSHTYSPIKPGQSSKISFVFDSTKKDKSGTTDIDLYMKNLDPKSGNQYFEILQYSYELVE